MKFNKKGEFKAQNRNRQHQQQQQKPNSFTV